MTRPLAERLIADAGGEQDQLPLIQHGLMLLWRRKVGADTERPGLAEEAAEPLRPAPGLAEDSTPFVYETGPEAPSASLGHELHDAAPSYRDDSGPAWRLDLDDYWGTGGLATLLSTHADQVMAAVALDQKREKITEHLFRALTDINADGHAMRRPQTLAQLQAVTRADETTLGDIVGAFRADGVSFLNPYGSDPLEPEQQIDISHEALIRCWGRITDEKKGWLQREFRDGLIWKTLRVMAQKEETLSPAATDDRDEWLETLPSPAWTERYDGGWGEVQGLMDKSRQARDVEARRRREFDESKRREAEERAQRAEDARQAASDLAAKEHELRAAQEEIAAEAITGRRRSRRFAIMAGLFAVAASVAAGVAFYSWQQAAFAEVAAETARDEAQLGDSFFRAVQARNELEDDLPILAMHLALTGLPEDPMSPSARPWVGETGGVLIAALGAKRENGVLGSHEGTVWAAGFSPEGDTGSSAGPLTPRYECGT